MGAFTPAPIHRLDVARAFGKLSQKEKLYAHYMSKAAWSGTRIILRQVSPESNTVFDLLMELSRNCQTGYGGDWYAFGRAQGVRDEDTEALLEYASTFLSNIGNYYVVHDQKSLRTKAKGH